MFNQLFNHTKVFVLYVLLEKLSKNQVEKNPNC